MNIALLPSYPISYIAGTKRDVTIEFEHYAYVPANKELQAITQHLPIQEK